jgi:hypothetical protein
MVTSVLKFLKIPEVFGSEAMGPYSPFEMNVIHFY